MMTQQLNVSILSAPIAAIDRRALSQAWFSALHFARDSEPAAAPHARNDTACTMRAANHQAQAHEATHAHGPAAQTRVACETPQRRNLQLVTVERRAPRTPLARKIERTFLDPRSKIKRATFAVGKDGARVHVMLQSRGARVRLVAFCAPRIRENVARALEQARYALAARGIAMDLETGSVLCS
jgi:hypothetical protein